MVHTLLRRRLLEMTAISSHILLFVSKYFRMSVVERFGGILA
jgi:hypothetical protein